jgi:hypothetical protein
MLPTGLQESHQQWLSLIIGGATISTTVIWFSVSKKREKPAPRGFEFVHPVLSVEN